MYFSVDFFFFGSLGQTVKKLEKLARKTDEVGISSKVMLSLTGL